TNGKSVKDMTTKFDKLVKLEGQDFRRWQKKIHFLLTTLKLVYVLSTPGPEWHEDEILETTRKRMKWENDDYICRGHILNGMSDFLFDIYQNIGSTKELWESLESKYMVEDASSKKFLVSNFMNYKMVDTRPVMEQFHEMLRILRQYVQHNLMMDEAISVAVIIDKLPPSWKDFKHSLKHKKEELNLVQLGSHIRIEEGLRNQELDNNPKGKNQIGSSSVNMVEGDGAKNSKNNKNNKNKRKFNNGGNDSAGSNGSKDPKKQQDDEVAWWVDSGATSHVCKDLRWFQVCKSIEDGSCVKMGNVATEPIKGIGRVSISTQPLIRKRADISKENVLYKIVMYFRLFYGVYGVGSFHTSPLSLVYSVPAMAITRLSVIHKIFQQRSKYSVIMTNGKSVKDMTTKFDKLVKFEGQDFRRWQKKIHFLLTTLKLVYVLSTPSPEWHEDETLETTRKRMKWENDDYI
nr:zinc finger, CCHC-type [Tanacetum cinerariifolium]